MNHCPHCDTDLPADAAFCPECGTTTAPELMTLGGLTTLGEESTRGRRDLEAPPLLEAGTLFAERYTVEELIGVGGMGVVYRALDTVTGERVALKLIRPERVGGEAELKRLVTEGVTARGIRHKNVIAVFDVGVSGGQPFLSMELITGQSLRAWHRSQKVKGQDVPFDVATRLIGEILDGLNAAHAAGVTHRDLKPENVMLIGDPLSPSGSVKILDFGIARSPRDSSDRESSTGLGTPHYMAPEQITNPDLATPAADLYSVSVMFYELLVDVLPQGHWQPPSGGRSDIPTKIDELIERGLSNRPANRPQNAAAYHEALDAATGASDVIGRVTDLHKRWSAKRSLKERKTAIAIAGGILLIAALGEVLPDEDDVPAHVEISTIHHDDDDEVEVKKQTPPIPPVVKEEKSAPSPADLSGTWYDGYGGSYRITVDRRGTFQGSGTTFDGYSVAIDGRISGGSLSYRIGANGQLLATGGGTWDGSLHMPYETLDLDGYPVLSGYFHVNHSNRPSCP